MKKRLPKISSIPIIEKIRLAYPLEELFTRFADSKDACFLNSSLKNDTARYSFIGLNPFLSLNSKKNSIRVETAFHSFKTKGEPFEYLEKIVNNYTVKNPSTFPFIAGGMGYFSYDLKDFIEKLSDKAKDDLKLFDMYFVFYRTLLIHDNLDPEHLYISALDMLSHKTEKTCHLLEKIKKSLASRHTNSHKLKTRPFQPNLKLNFSKQEYLKAIKKIIAYIRAGDIYQACLSQRFETPWPFHPYSLYLKLNKINPAPFSAYMNFKKSKIISSSPELFLRLRDNIIETRPMKGTRPRGKTFKKDSILKKELEKSEKDKAELMMIMDLERNDLGKISIPGSIKVTKMRRIETYPTVFQAISVIKGKTRENISPVSILKAAFPGGSISGCPKIRAMEIIEELEPTKRNVYTGAIGYISFHNTMDLNIAIRTMIVKNKTAYFQAGGGITSDSIPEAEYKETLHKAKALIDSLKA